MAIGGIVIVNGQERENIDIFHIVRFFLHVGSQRIVIKMQIAVGFSEEIVLIGYNGEIKFGIRII